MTAERTVASRSLAILGFLMVAGIGWLVVAFLGAIDARSGITNLELRGIDPATGAELWTVKFNGSAFPEFGPHHLLVKHEGGVDAIDAGGDVVWQFGHPAVGHIGVAGGVVAITTFDEAGDVAVVALDETSGEVLWRGPGHSVESAGAELLLTKEDKLLRAFLPRTGEQVAGLDRRAKDVAASDAVAAVLVGETLRTMSADGVRVLARRLERSRIEAINDEVVVVARTVVVDDEPNRRLLTGYELTSGEVRWRQTLDNYPEAIADAAVMRLPQSGGTVEIDLRTGEVQPIDRQAKPLAVEIAGEDGDVFVHGFVRTILRGDGSTDYLIAADGYYAGSGRHTYAVDPATGQIRWRFSGASAVAAGDGIVVLDSGAGYHVVAEADGRALAEVSRRRSSTVAVVDGAAVIATDGVITTIDGTGAAMRLADGLDVRTRIVASGDGVVVVRHPDDSAGGRRVRVLTGYEAATGELLWSHAFRAIRETEIDGDILVVTRPKAVTEIDLLAGTATTRPPAERREAPPPAPLLAVAFDRNLTRVLWTANLVGGHDRVESVGVVDDVVVITIINSQGRL